MAETMPFFTHLLVGFLLESLDITKDFYGCLDPLQLKENLNDVLFITHDGLAHTCVKCCLDGCVVKVYDKLACQMTSHSQVDCFGTQVILYVRPRGRLAEPFGQSVDKGCTRVEIRLTGNMALGLNVQKMHEMIDGVVNMCGDAVQHTTHKQSIQVLWHENTDHVLICKNNEIFFVDYFNSLTQKIMGSCAYRQKHVNIDMVCRHVANKVSKKDIRCGCLKSSAAQRSWAVLQKNMTAL